MRRCPALSRCLTVTSTFAWRSFFTNEDVEILRPLLRQMLPDPRYDDWKLDPEPRIEPAEVSQYVAKIAAV